MILSVTLLGIRLGIVAFLSMYGVGHADLTTDISKLLRETGVKSSDYSVVIARLDDNPFDDSVLFKHLELEPRTPASINKIVTSIIALEKLGPDFRFQTTLATSFPDSLCLKGGGDPALSFSDMKTMAQNLKAMGVRIIPGDLILDETLFPAQTYYDETEFDETNLNRPYGARVGALSVEFNAMGVTVQPAKIRNGRPTAVIWPAISGIPVENLLTPGRSNWATVDFSGAEDLMRLTLRGNYVPNSPDYTAAVAVPQPALYAGMAFRHHFLADDEGLPAGELHGSVRVQPCAPNAQTLLTYPSKPLSELLPLLGKKSLNLVAEMLALRLGDYSCDRSMETFCQYMMDNDVPIGLLDIKNGSGLSRSSKIDAWAMLKILHYGFHDLAHKEVLMNSLSVGGVDGTLKRAFKAFAVPGRRLLAKTGTLGNAQTAKTSSLAFFVEEQGKPPLIGVFMFDGYSVPLPGTSAFATLRQKQEAILLRALQSL